MTAGSSPSGIRIAHIITGLGVGGAERMVMKLVTGTSARIRHLVLVMSGEVDLGFDRRDTVEIITLDMKRGRPSLAGAYRALVALRAFQPTIIQSWLYHADLLATLLAVICGCKKLVWNVRCSDMELERYATLTKIVRRLLVVLSHVPNAIISNSRRGIAVHQKLGYRAREWVLIGNGFDLEKFRPDPVLARRFRERLAIPARSRIVGLVARHDPMKDHDSLIAAAQIVFTQRDDVVYYLCGAGIRKLGAKTEALGLQEKFVLEDVRQDVEAIYPGCDFFVLSSAFGEGFPNVLGEAMSCGVPCITTAVGDAADIVADTGIVVSPRAPERLAAAMLEALDWSPTEYARRSAAARARISDHYSLQSVVAQYEALYSRLAESCAG